jgi:hypothetical protein
MNISDNYYGRIIIIDISDATLTTGNNDEQARKAVSSEQ